MISYDILAYFLGINALIYIAFNLPLEIVAYKDKESNQKEDSGKYDIWENRKKFVTITIFASFYFWTFFILWPVYHIVAPSDLLSSWTFDLPYPSSWQYIGIFLIGTATITEILGRIGRGRSAISWGVPSKLKTGYGHRIVRHPLYASYIYYFIGIQLAFQNLLLLPMLLGILGYYSITKYEESILEYEFEDEFRDYQKEVGMLVPFLGKRN